MLVFVFIVDYKNRDFRWLTTKIVMFVGCMYEDCKSCHFFKQGFQELLRFVDEIPVEERTATEARAWSFQKSLMFLKKSLSKGAWSFPCLDPM